MQPKWMMCLLAAGTALPAAAATADFPRDPLAPQVERPTVITVTGARQPDAFGTAALDAGVTLYDARFRRVSATDRDAPEVLEVAAKLRGLPRSAQLAVAKAEVERRVRLVSDLESLGVADLWLNAGETLRRGEGDDEDIAIAEMQVLKAAGFPVGDLYLSLGRHYRRGAHIVLLARTPEGYFLLDPTEPTPVPAVRSKRFVPVMTIGSGKSWVHGYRVARTGATGRVAAR